MRDSRVCAKWRSHVLRRWAARNNLLSDQVSDYIPEHVRQSEIAADLHATVLRLMGWDPAEDLEKAAGRGSPAGQVACAFFLLHPMKGAVHGAVREGPDDRIDAVPHVRAHGLDSVVG